jgi:hypothetical protein
MLMIDRLIRQHQLSGNIESPSSEFILLVEDLERWYQHLPVHLQLTEDTIYIHKDMENLGQIFFLHLCYHGAATDLTRIALPGFSFPLAKLLDNATEQFRKQCQKRSRYHSDEISRYISMGLPYGTKPFDDQLCHLTAFQATKVQVVHSAIESECNAERELTELNIKTNIRLLNFKMRDGPNNIVSIEVYIS